MVTSGSVSQYFVCTWCHKKCSLVPTLIIPGMICNIFWQIALEDGVAQEWLLSMISKFAQETKYLKSSIVISRMSTKPTKTLICCCCCFYDQIFCCDQKYFSETNVVWSLDSRLNSLLWHYWRIINTLVIKIQLKWSQLWRCQAYLIILTIAIMACNLHLDTWW